MVDCILGGESVTPRVGTTPVLERGTCVVPTRGVTRADSS